MKILLTGSSTGIGRALAQRLLSEGHGVWGFARSAQEELAAHYPNTFRYSRCDLSSWPQVRKSFDEVTESWIQADALVCCAGVQGEISRALACDPEAWSATVRANLDGTLYALRASSSLLAKAPRRAKIVCFSGGGATKARPRFSAYGAAKTAIVRLVETIAEEEKDSPLDINAIAPGAIHTRLTDEVLALGQERAGQAEYQAALRQKTTGEAPLAKALDCVCWLLSPASDGISGRLISAPWDALETLQTQREVIARSELYTLRRVTPAQG